MTAVPASVRRLLALAAVLLIFAGGMATVALSGDAHAVVEVTVTVERERLIEGKPIAWWRARAVHNRLQVNRLKRTLLYHPSTVEALKLASVVYRVPYTLLYWKASCESTGGRGLKPKAKNRRSTAKGLGQFLDSTWASTPFAGFSVYSVFANALAMGWMHSQPVGRGGEWAASEHCWARRVS